MIGLLDAGTRAAGAVEIQIEPAMPWQSDGVVAHDRK